MIAVVPQRFGSALVPWGSLQVKQKQYAKDFQSIDPDCQCPTCKRQVNEKPFTFQAGIAEICF